MLACISDGVQPDPKSSVAVVAKDGDEIVGRIFLIQPVHTECPWVREDLRGGTLLKRLTDAIEKEAKDRGVKKLFAFGASDQMESYISRLGYQKQPLTVWIKDLE